MADNGASTNGHSPARRRKHIYPPPEQMAAEQAASAARPRIARTVRARVTVPDFGPEAEAPPAAPVMTAIQPVESAVAMTETDDGAGSDAERVELRLSAVGMVDAGAVEFTQGALGAARADKVSVDQG